MNLGEFHSAATAVLAVEPNRRELQRVSEIASSLAEMVGWAPGVIDPRGEVFADLERIRSSARQLFESKPMPEIAVLHDAVAGLMDAIACHDRDLQPVGPDHEDLVDSW